MRLYFFLLLFTLLPSLNAHPSWGIAVLPGGDIYFVDVTHHDLGSLWQLTPNGRLRARLRNVHAHALQPNEDGSLWIAEQKWIQGRIEGEGHNYLYRYWPETARIDTLLFTDDWDQFFGGAFGVDSRERLYFVINGKIWRRPLDGATTQLVDFPFERITTIYLDPDDQLWITDKDHKNGTLFRWTETVGLEEWVTGLLPTDPVNPVFEEERHQLLFGINRDENGNLYLADNAARRIQKIDADRRVSTFYESEPPWHPVGVAFRGDTAYIMESGFDRGMRGPRILRRDASGEITLLVNVETYEPGRSEIGQPAAPSPSGARNTGYWIGGVILTMLLAMIGLRRRLF